MIFFSNTYCQLDKESEKNKDVRETRTYLDPLLNIVGTRFNYGNANGELSDYKKSLIGLQVGVSFQAGLTPKFSLVSELYFLMKGGGLEAENPLTLEESNIRLYTFELPVLARFHFGKIHLNTGPSVAYNFYGSQKIGDSTSDLSFGNLEEDFERWEFGVQIGGGYTFRTKKKRFTLDIRYNYGLTDVSKSKSIYNRSLIASLHFSNPWKKNPLGLKSNH